MKHIQLRIIPINYCNGKGSCNEKKICGKQKIENSRIYGGVKTQLGEYPWMAIIIYSKRNTTSCTGSLIDKKIILTVAHCLTGDVVTSAGNP